MPIWFWIGAVLLAIFGYMWWNGRWWYRAFQRRYHIKLPFLCTVQYTKEPDKILWGVRRYRYLRQDGKRDRRRALNIKWTYPTVIVVYRYKVKIWNLEEGRRVFRQISPHMKLALRDILFEGKVDGDLYEYFRGSKVLFVRYCLKLLEFYGWQVELSGYSGCNGLARNGTEMYAIHCVFRQTPMVLNDVARLPPVAQGIRWIVIGNTKVSTGAREYANANHIYLMDRECIRKTFVYEEPQFL